MLTGDGIIKATAPTVDFSESWVEAYALALRKYGWWPSTQRGRGAVRLGSREVGKMFLALIVGGPTDVHKTFLAYANLYCANRDEPWIALARDVLALPHDAKFLDYIMALVGLYEEGKTDDLIFWSPSAPGHLDDFLYDGPDLSVQISGPYPSGSISFLLSKRLIDRLVDAGHDRKDLLGPKTISFVDEFIGHVIDQNAIGDKTSASAFANVVQLHREQYARGIRFTRALDGRPFEALGKALRKGAP